MMRDMGSEGLAALFGARLELSDALQGAPIDQSGPAGEEMVCRGCSSRGFYTGYSPYSDYAFSSSGGLYGYRDLLYGPAFTTFAPLRFKLKQGDCCGGKRFLRYS
jgi:hypothetical protein